MKMNARKASGNPGMAMRPARWRQLAVAAALAAGLVAPSAWAFLGRATVLSPIGQPLRAEIDLPGISAEELATLRVDLADANDFRAANMAYSPTLLGLKLEIERRPNGRTVVRLSGSAPVSDPFLDLVLQANWAGGRLVRGYTLLFDPPNLPAATPGPLPLPPVVAAAPLAPPPAPAPTPAAPSPAPSPTQAVTAPPSPVAAPAPSGPPPARPPAAAAPAPASAPAPGPAPATAKRLTVKPGDTAGKLAAAAKPREVSLDQMLVALLRANPAAFSKGNVNRLRAGATLDMPSAAEAQAVDAAEARESVVAQSRDFAEYRRRLAALAPATAPTEPARSASGTVKAEVKEPKAAPPAADKLTLSKGQPPAKAGGPGTEDAIASQRAAQEAQTRVAELSRNMDELAKLGEAAQGGKTSTAGTAPAVADTPAPAPAPATEGSGPSVSSTAVPPPGQDASSNEWLRTAIDSPWALPTAGGLLALLATLGLWRWRRRRAPVGAPPPVDTFESPAMPPLAAAGSGDEPFFETGSPGDLREPFAGRPPAPDLDLDLDGPGRSADETVAADYPEGPDALVSELGEPETPRSAEQEAAMDLGFDVSAQRGAAPDAAPPTAAAGQDFDLDDLPDGDEAATGAPAASAALAPGDLPASVRGLSLDLDTPADAAQAQDRDNGDNADALATSADPLQTKLALAQEFAEIGDHEGARTLAQEVAASAAGPLRERAERLLAELP